METVIETESYFTVREVAQKLRLHEQTVRDDIRAGNLKTDMLGGPRRTRISTAEYRRYVEWLKSRVQG